MAAPTGFKLRLEPQDEYTHTPDAASNYNESMYFNVFDPARKIGGWFRLRHRPHEGPGGGSGGGGRPARPHRRGGGGGKPPPLPPPPRGGGVFFGGKPEDRRQHGD